MGVCALAAAGGLLTVPSSSAATAPPAVFTGGAAAVKPCQVTLPGGLRATVTGNAGQRTARLTDPARVKESVTTYWSDGHQYLMPSTAADGGAAHPGPAAYDVTALADRTCGQAAARPAAQTATRKGTGRAYKMVRLTIDTRDETSVPATSGNLLLTNLDDNTFVRRTYIITHGVVRAVVPAGHYAALFEHWKGTSDGLTYWMTINPEFTVRDGTRVTLDASTATVPVPVPVTPRPAQLVSRSFAVYRGDGSGPGAEHGLWFHQQWPSGVSLTNKIRVNPGAGPVTHGRFSVVSTFDFASPEGTAQPYAYHLAESADRTLTTYPSKADPATLATVRRSYTGTGGDATPALVVGITVPTWAARTREILPAAFQFLPAGTEQTEYYSALPDTAWAQEYADTARGTALASGLSVYRAGRNPDETFGAGAPHPNGPLATRVGTVYCGACADATSLRFALLPAGDNTPGHEGVYERQSSDSVTLKRDGALYATGESGLSQVSVPVPAGRARYELRLANRSTGADGRLSPGTDTTWTFTADPGHGRTLPDDMLCPAEGNACGALPLLYAYTNTDADLMNRLTPGRHTLSLDVGRQQYAPPGVVTGAEMSVSYDDGAHWQKLRTRGGAGRFTADCTVPSTASGHTVSLRLAAWDSTGSRVDQELPGAYQVP
ncbi:hypothetical protein ACWDQO_23770 [Streptomyces sp. NPDC003703]|uniref:hypothetical protein n=1 Tax=Streptomyces sp. NPDC003283 TaxID=3364681 RepID=UPI0036AECD35